MIADLKPEKTEQRNYQNYHTMSWDDEDFDVSNKTAPVASWEDEAEDEPVMESWEVDEDEEAQKKKALEDKKKADLKKKQDLAKTKKQSAKTGDKTLLNIDKVDEKTRRELLKKAELESDLNNAADLFGGLGVANDKLDELTAHPKERAAAAAAANQKPAFSKDTPLELHPLFQPTNKQEFEKLRKTLAPILTGLAKDLSLLYSSNLAIDLIRDLVQPLSVESTRKVVSTLNVVQREKEKQERQARLLKAGGTSTGGAGKKKAKPLVKTNVNDTHFKKDALDDLDANYDDFGDDDFM